MRLTATKPLPDNNELIETFKREFSSDYSYELFGLDGQKTILIGKSPFIGAQVSMRQNEITIQATPPSVVTGNFLFFFSLVGIDVVLGVLFGTKLKRIEKEVTDFLKSKFGE
jgi:hypothetical protein